MSEAEQLPLGIQRAARPSPSRRAAKGSRPQQELAGTMPVARVRVDAQVPHLDHDFDYAVPAALDSVAVPGCRVRVRFAGRLVDGYIVSRADVAEVTGELRRIERVIGAEPVLTAETLALVEAVAERCAGTFSDVVRAAVPARHARAEGRSMPVSEWSSGPADAGLWDAYAHGGALLSRIGEPDAAVAPARAAWSAAPAASWAAEAGALARTVLSKPTGGVLIVVPDSVAVTRMQAELRDAVEAEAVAVLTAEAGPERRYGQFLRALRGAARVVIGTRGAVFAPVRDLRLVIVWDDGDDALCDPQAPYWDARDVAALRSHLSGCHLVIGSPARSLATQQWCSTGFARSVAPTRATVNARGPRATGVLDTDVARDEAAAFARIPHRAWEAARAALRQGPVLVQVGRRGYLPSLACQQCRTPARCACGGPLSLAGGTTVPACAWCGSLAARWKCPECGSTRLRASAVGAERTAEEIGRAFPGVPVLSSHGGHRLETVEAMPSVVVSTPGAEPECPGGYACVLILDARAALARRELEAGEDAVRRWMSAARLAAPRAPVVIAADNALPAVQAVVRWDAPGWAQRELADRASAGLPPAQRFAALLGEPTAIAEVASSLSVPHRLLGPVPYGDRRHPDRQRGLVAVSRDHGAALARELRAITVTRSAKGKASAVVHVQLDPRDI